MKDSSFRKKRKALEGGNAVFRGELLYSEQYLDTSEKENERESERKINEVFPPLITAEETDFNNTGTCTKAEFPTPQSLQNTKKKKKKKKKINIF